MAVSAQSIRSSAQDFNYSGQAPTVATFLKIAPDIRAAGMGNLTTLPAHDSNSAFGNPARIAFAQDYDLGEIAASFNPVAPGISKDIKLMSLAGYVSLDQYQYAGVTFQYFSLGDVSLTDQQGNESSFVRPNEWALGGFYSKRLSDFFALGVTIKGIYSNITGGVAVNGEETRPGFAIASDIGLKADIPMNNDFLIVGLAFNNVGTKMSYSSFGKKSFLPMSIKLGTGYRHMLDEENYIFAGLELGKGLVPSLPTYDESGKILKGEDPDKSVVSSLLNSFRDNPNGLQGEFKEVGFNFGVEAALINCLMLRAGYQYENETYGRLSHSTIGIGYFKDFGNKRIRFDTAFLMPSGQNLALRNTFKIGAAISFLDF